MIIWLDAQLSPALAPWIQSTFNVETHALRDLGLRDAEDSAIFKAASAAGAVIMTKDSDFITLYHQNGPPPQVIWKHVEPVSQDDSDYSFTQGVAVVRAR